ncbi:MAG: spore maturation protein [FCB group bacterium]|nr:spore maturation protein [FCB group bacterium]
MIETIVSAINEGAKYVIPLLLVGIPFYGLVVKKVKVYESFVEGAKDGFTIAVRIIPYLVAILVAIGMFRASGALDLMLTFLTPVLHLIGFPPENLPLAIMRPLSGSGSLGLLTDLVNEYGPDSLFAKIGATMFGSTETTFYVLAVYFGSVGIKKSRHALIAGLIADAVGIFSAVYIWSPVVLTFRRTLLSSDIQ